MDALTHETLKLLQEEDPIPLYQAIDTLVQRTMARRLWVVMKYFNLKQEGLLEAQILAGKPCIFLTRRGLKRLTELEKIPAASGSEVS